MNLSEMQTRLAEVRAAILSLADQPGDLEGDDVERWDALNAEHDTLVVSVAAAEERARRVDQIRAAAAAGQVERGADQGPPQVLRKVDTDNVDLRAMSTAERASAAMKRVEEFDGLDADQRAQVARLLGREQEAVRRTGRTDAVTRRVIATGRPEYREAFAKIMIDPVGGHFGFTDDERRAVAEVRAMSTTDSAGGYAIPFGLDPTFVLTGNGTANPFRRISRVIQVGPIDQWRGVTVGEATGSWDAEGTEVSDDAPTFSQPTIDIHKAAIFVPVSFEAFEDIANLESELRVVFDDAKDRLESSAFATGSGSGQPWGIVTAVSVASSVFAAAASAFALGDVYKVQEALPPRFRGKGAAALSWVSSNEILNDIRQFGTANNYHGFTVDLTAENIPSVLGSNLYESSVMASVITTNALVLVYGDFSRYYIIDRVGASMEFIPHLFSTGNGRPMGRRGFYMHWRVGADSIDDNAFRILKLATS